MDSPGTEEDLQGSNVPGAPEARREVMQVCVDVGVLSVLVVSTPTAEADF